MQLNSCGGLGGSNKSDLKLGQSGSNQAGVRSGRICVGLGFLVKRMLFDWQTCCMFRLWFESAQGQLEPRIIKFDLDDIG